MIWHEQMTQLVRDDVIDAASRGANQIDVEREPARRTATSPAFAERPNLDPGRARAQQKRLGETGVHPLRQNSKRVTAIPRGEQLLFHIDGIRRGRVDVQIARVELHPLFILRLTNPQAVLAAEV